MTKYIVADSAGYTLRTFVRESDAIAFARDRHNAGESAWIYSDDDPHGYDAQRLFDSNVPTN